MAQIVKLRKGAKRKDVVSASLLPQASCSDPAVRQLFRAGEVVRLKDSWTDPAKIADAERRLALVENEMLIRLPVNMWYGAFHMQYKVDLGGRVGYVVTCACGTEHTLTTEQLVRALIEHTGCRSSCCQQKVLLQLFWGTLVESLRLQWRIMQVCHARQIPSYWGGTLDTVYERDLAHGFARMFKELLVSQIDLAHPEFRWITPLDPRMPFGPGNLTLALTPWRGVTNLNRLAPVIAGQSIPIMEICSSMDVSVERVLEALTDESVNPDELFVHLLQEN